MIEDIKKVGIVSCSNGQLSSYKKDIDELDSLLMNRGITPVYSDYIYATDSVAAGKPMDRAKALMDFYNDENIDAIFDISGGDIANEILDYLDYQDIATSSKRFWGYSDLTTVINAIYSMTGKESVLYQAKNLVWDESGKQKDIFMTESMYRFDYDFIQGKSMKGTVVGGNIRCFLKLAGTPYFPDANGKVLFLEALSGGEAQIRTYFAQLKQLGVFSVINGLFLGTFTELEGNENNCDIASIIKDYVDVNLPVAKTSDIGHGKTSKALVIGKEYSL